MPRLIAALLMAAVIQISMPGQAEECQATPPVGKAMAFQHKRSELMVKLSGQARHRGQDVLVVAGQPQWLIAKFAYGQADKDLKGEPVDIYAQKAPPCGPWSLLATVHTSADGEWGTVAGIEDDGGRIFYQIPEPLRLPVGRSTIFMRVQGDHSSARFDLLVTKPDTSVVVFDIDGTLTTHDKEVTKEYLAKMVKVDYDPKGYGGAVDVVTRWHQAGYQIVYLTGRPDFLRTPTDEWLGKNGFPKGVLRLADSLKQFLPTSDGVASYKAAVLDELRTAGFSIAAAYGNARTDIEAYGNAGVPKDRTYIIGPLGGDEGTRPVVDYPSHLKELVMPD